MSAHRRADLIVVASALALIALAAVVGRELNARGLPIVLPAPPLVAEWSPHVGWGTPLVGLCVLLGLHIQRRAAGLAWRRLLLAGWLLNVAWLCSLPLIDGLRTGWAEVLLNPNEYLEDLPRISSLTEFVSSFTDYIAFGPGVDGDLVWTTHVAGHPPLATLVFWVLDRVGLGGGFWAGALCIFASSAASVAVPVMLRELGAVNAARRLVPFAALFPGAVWMAVSADGLFAGVATTGLALACRGAVRGRLLPGLAGGLLLGASLFLSYGLVLFGLVVGLVLILTVQRVGWRHTAGAWLAAVLGVLAVTAVHLAFGFNWFTGLTQLRIRYYQGIASDRPYAYFVWANLAAWLVSCSPLLAVGVARAAEVVVRRRREPVTQDRTVALLALSGVLAALVANASGLSKAETERIWLSFGVIAWSSLALLRGRRAAWALTGGAVWAVLVNSLLATGW